MIFGLSTHCELTMFDEPTNGMDEAVRTDFYRALLKDYIAHPRSILISSHHLSEIEHLLEDILLIHKGKVVFHQSLDEVKEYLGAELMERYYFQQGRTAYMLRFDKELKRAVQELSSNDKNRTRN